MAYCKIKIQPLTILTVHDGATAIQVWRNYGPLGQTLIRRIVVETPLTDAQLRRMSSRLREVVAA